MAGLMIARMFPVPTSALNGAMLVQIAVSLIPRTLQGSGQRQMYLHFLQKVF